MDLLFFQSSKHGKKVSQVAFLQNVVYIGHLTKYLNPQRTNSLKGDCPRYLDRFSIMFTAATKITTKPREE